jgi:hypothetical protein
LQRHGTGYLRQNLLLENPRPKMTEKLPLKMGLKRAQNFKKANKNKGSASNGRE